MVAGSRQPDRREKMELNRHFARMLTILLLLSVSPASHAEYLIYLKGGHYIVADNCTFSSRQESVKEGETKEDSFLVRVEDCTKGKPAGQIFWSTIDGKFGEVNPDDVYYIFGSKNLASIEPQRSAKPLEGYLITNRGESFVNSKVFRENEGRVYGLERDDLANINRRGVTEIVPAADVTSRSGEGLCPGERGEFGVTDTKRPRDHFVGEFKNLSRESCMEVSFEVEVYEGETFIGKFPVKESGAVSPGRSKRFDAPVPTRLAPYVERSGDREGGVRLCYALVQSLAQCGAEVRKETTPAPPR